MTDRTLSAHIVRKLRAARESRGWSQEHTAELLGVHVVTFRRWESRKQTPPFDRLDAWASLLGCKGEPCDS